MSAEPHNHGDAPFSTNPQKRLKLVHCEQCETNFEELREAAGAIRDLEVDLRKKRKRIKDLEGQIKRGLEDNPEHQRAEELFDYWVKVTGRSSRTLWDVDRERAILRAVKIVEKKWSDKDDPELAWRVLAFAVLGAAREGLKKYDEIALIVKNARMIEMHLDHYRVWCVKQGKEPKV